jgi:hypothetical protein
MQQRRPRYLGSGRTFVEFLLSAHITALAVSMLVYANERFWVVAFATAVAIASKTLFRVSFPLPDVPPGRWPTRHVLNPSNFGITVVLLLFPWVGISPPYHFTENVSGALDWVLPAIVVCTGSLLNWKFTEKLPLIATWLGCFVLQATVRSVWHDLPLTAALLPMTGLAFLLFTFYMVTDPATTPSSKRGQIAFGGAVALVYGVLVSLHVVFGLFFALTLVSSVRGLYHYRLSWLARRAFLHAPEPLAVHIVPVVETSPREATTLRKVDT